MAAIAALVIGGGSTAYLRLSPEPTAAATATLVSAPSAQRAGGRVVAARHTGVRTLGNQVRATTAGTIVGLRLFRTAGDHGARRASVWTSAGRRLGTLRFPATRARGWQTASFTRPVNVRAHRGYVVGYVSPDGRYSFQRLDLRRHPLVDGDVVATRALQRTGRGVPRKPVRGRAFLIRPVFVAKGSGSTGSGWSGANAQSTLTAFPDSSNVGVPAGTALTAYSGPMTITRDNTVIDAKTITGTVIIKANNVSITRSRINGILSSDDGGSVSVTDSAINAGNQEEFPAVSFSGITLRRVDITGGEHSVQCSEYCTVVDSYLHGQYLGPNSSTHINAFISNGGDHIVLRHNTLHCTVPLSPADGGCTGDASLFGDFSPISDVVIDNNYFRANQISISYCLYAGYNPGKPYGTNPTRITVTNNIFERGANNKCGVYGPVTSFLNANGNTWSNNTWADTRAGVAAAQ